jgi:cellulose biosynthesis protein BcsQ
VSAPVTIALLKRKGGSGATIAAGSLAVALAELGHRVAAIDLDPQGSLALWARSGPGKLAGIVTSIEVQEVADLRAAVAATGADRVILDSPPGFDRPSLVAALVADVAIVPVAPASFDVAAAREVVELIGEARARRPDAGPVVLMLPSRWAKSCHRSRCGTRSCARRASARPCSSTTSGRRPRARSGRWPQRSRSGSRT